jgi:hypothetical protein
MEVINNIKNKITMKTEDPFWNENFSENMPKWIHIWVVTIGLGSGIMFIINSMFNMVNNSNAIVRLISVAGLICLVLMILNRDTFLPFLSENFVPAKFLKLEENHPDKFEKKITVNVRPNSKVIYWAADPGKEISKSWKKGYGKFDNSGVTTSDKNGIAEIMLVCPSKYIVHGYKILPKHVHYRVYNENSQMLSRIYTVVLTNDCT